MDTTQADKILAYCKRHGSITVRDAFALYINSPTKVISDMKKSGKYRIERRTERELGADGKVKSAYKRYWISEAE